MEGYNKQCNIIIFLFYSYRSVFHNSLIIIYLNIIKLIYIRTTYKVSLFSIQYNIY